LPAGRNLVARSFVALFAQTQVWRGKSKKRRTLRNDFWKRILPAALNALPFGLVDQGM
jgi:hypothetical protein